VEALEDWWFWSRHAAAVTSATTKLRIGSALDQADLVKVADLLPAIRPEQHFPPPPSADGEHGSPSEVLAAQRHHLARVAQQWLDLADVTVALEWPRGSTGSVGASQPTLTYRGSGLFAAIAIEIALAATTTKAIYICDKCGLAYTRQRARRGIYAARNLPAGHVIAAEDLLILRPEGPIPADSADDLVGAQLKHALPERGAFTLSGLEFPPK